MSFIYLNIQTFTAYVTRTVVTAKASIAALGMNYYDMGRQTGKIVVRILKGEKPGAIAFEVGRNTTLEINAKAAREQGVTLSPALLKEGKVVVP